MARPRNGSIRWRDGAWRVQAYLGRDELGRPRYRSLTVRTPNTKAGESAARRALSRLVLEAEGGQHRPAPRGSFKELAERWIEARTPEWPTGAPKHTRQVLGNHVYPSIGDRRIDAVTPADLDALYGRLRLKLSPATVRRIHASIRAAFEQAVRWGMLDRNPAMRATPPRAPARPPRKIPDAAVLRAAIDSVEADDTTFAMFLRLAIHTGARRGEIVRLRWEDVTVGPEGAVVSFYQSKTDRWKHVPIGPVTASQLDRYRRDLFEQSMAIGAGRPVWVFPSWKSPGHHIHPHTTTHAWIALREKTGLDGVRLHDLRHTMVSVLLGAGVDVATVGDRSGHASKAVLLDVYGHSIDGAAWRAAGAIERWYEGKAEVVPDRQVE